jgi:hypothetical protein
MSKTTTFMIERNLARIAYRQLGLFTVRQAAEVGIAAQQIDHRLRVGTVHRLFRSVYRVAAVPPSFHQRILGGWLAAGADVCIARYSAAFIHGLPIGTLRNDTVDLLAWGAENQSRSRIDGVACRRTVSEPHTQSWQGARITTPAQTVCDLAAVLSPDRLARSVDHVIANRMASIGSVSLLALGRPATGFKGRATLLTLLDERADGRVKHRSRKEQRVAKWLRSAGLGQFIPNYTIAEADDLEVDFAWELSYVSLEVSPFFTHGSEAKQKRDIERRRLLAPTQWIVIEATDADIENEASFAPVVALLRRLIDERTPSLGVYSSGG